MVDVSVCITIVVNDRLGLGFRGGFSRIRATLHTSALLFSTMHMKHDHD